MSSNTYTLKELADLVGGNHGGVGSLKVAGVADLASAGKADISFLLKKAQTSLLETTSAAAVVVPRGTETKLPVIEVENPALAITLIHRKFLEHAFEPTGVHDSACLGDGCSISNDVSIGPQVVIGNNVTIGDRVSIEPGVYVGDNVVIGDDVVLMANAVVRFGCKVGNRVIIQSGAVIGGDGYGYVQDEKGRHIKRPHVGIVILEDDVEIGANSCVDRATFGATIIKQGAKVDNLVQVAHNVIVGEGSLLVAQCGIAGSSTLGRGVVLGGQTAVTDHATLGDGVMAGGKTGIPGNVEAGSMVSGYPAIDHRTWRRASSAFSKLPQLVKDVRDLAKKMVALEKSQESHSENAPTLKSGADNE